MKSQLLKTPLPYLAILFAHIIWGANFVVSKVTLQEFPVMILAFSRFSLAILLIAPFLFSLSKKDLQIKHKDFIVFFVTGLLLITVHITLFFEGLVRTTSINASVLTMIVPILSLVAGWLFLKEKIYAINLLGAIIGFTGCLAVIGLPLILLGSSLETHLVGDFLIILSALCIVAGYLLIKESLSQYPPIIITSALFAIGAATFFIPAIITHSQKPEWILSVSFLGIIGFLFITILSSITAFFLQIWGLERIDLAQANLFLYIEPAIAASLAVPLLGERISYSFIVGTCMIVLGVYWGTLGKQHHHHAYHRSHRT